MLFLKIFLSIFLIGCAVFLCLSRLKKTKKNQKILDEMFKEHYIARDSLNPNDQNLTLYLNDEITGNVYSNDLPNTNFINWIPSAKLDPKQKVDTVVYTDTTLLKAHNDTFVGRHVGWLLESPVVFNKIQRKISKKINYSKFPIIFTHCKSLLIKGVPFKFAPVCHPFIPEENWKIFPKTQNLSIIASAKNLFTGQQLRHKVIKKYKGNIDAILGNGYQPLDDKTDGLAPFRYSITIENCREDFYFSEKIIDAFLTGTVPIYWGCPSIHKFFDPRGIIIFNSMKELKHIFANLSEEDYQNRLPFIRANFEIAKKYVHPNRYIYHHLNPLLNPTSTN